MSEEESGASMQEVRGGKYDVLVVGAGIGGIYSAYRLSQLGLSFRVLEAGGGVGGTWYWNRYPGARSDSDSTVYSFSDRFSEDLLQNWEWSERYPSQAEILRYLQWVADKLDLRRDIRFGTRVSSAVYDDATNRWTVTVETGERLVKGPYVAETFQVSVEEDYLVIDH